MILAISFLMRVGLSLMENGPQFTRHYMFLISLGWLLDNLLTVLLLSWRPLFLVSCSPQAGANRLCDAFRKSF